MSVVEQWRDRNRSLKAEYWRCSQCGRLAAVRRAACAQCGSDRAAHLSALPRTLPARGFSHAHLVIETLDQTPRTKPFMLMELPGGEMLPMALADSDAAHARDLVGENLRLVLRRARSGGADGPIVYARKVAADPHTRSVLQRNSNTTKREDGDG